MIFFNFDMGEKTVMLLLIESSITLQISVEHKILSEVVQAAGFYGKMNFLCRREKWKRVNLTS